MPIKRNSKLEQRILYLVMFLMVIPTLALLTFAFQDFAMKTKKPTFSSETHAAPFDRSNPYVAWRQKTNSCFEKWHPQEAELSEWFTEVTGKRLDSTVVLSYSGKFDQCVGILRVLPDDMSSTAGTDMSTVSHLYFTLPAKTVIAESDRLNGESVAKDILYDNNEDITQGEKQHIMDINHRIRISGGIER